MLYILELLQDFELLSLVNFNMSILGLEPLKWTV